MHPEDYSEQDQPDPVLPEPDVEDAVDQVLASLALDLALGRPRIPLPQWLVRWLWPGIDRRVRWSDAFAAADLAVLDGPAARELLLAADTVAAYREYVHKQQRMPAATDPATADQSAEPPRANAPGVAA